MFAKSLRLGGIDPVTVLSKVGSVDEGSIGIPDELKFKPGAFEAACKPVLQAKNLRAKNPI